MIDRFNSSLLSLSVNIPGADKLSRDAKIIFNTALDEILKLNLKIIKSKTHTRASGYEAQMVVNEDAIELKKRVVQIEENHPLGRFMDIDILGSDKKQISRKDVSMPQRRCFICGEDAKICSRSAKHQLGELLLFIRTKVQHYVQN